MGPAFDSRLAQNEPAFKLIEDQVFFFWSPSVYMEDDQKRTTALATVGLRDKKEMRHGYHENSNSPGYRKLSTTPTTLLHHSQFPATVSTSSPVSLPSLPFQHLP